MNLQTIKSMTGKIEYILLPVNTYQLLKKQIDKAVEAEYEAFVLEDYVQNPIALARIRAHFTQEELANHLKVSQAYISKIENQKKVSAKMINKIQKALKELSNQNTN